VIHSTSHKDVPQAEYDIVINPRMAFGTGHHETTSLVVEALLEADLTGKSLFDVGCGTSILSILARMRGAMPVTAIDTDTWCVENSKKNIALNGVTHITVELGDVNLLKGKDPFDVIVANINRNILLNDMKHYAACMKPCAELYVSGFYTEDIPVIREEAEKQGLRFELYKEKNNWAIVKFTLQSPPLMSV
jgi:ribosomal protein L11 methyltransferase